MSITPYCFYQINELTNNFIYLLNLGDLKRKQTQYGYFFTISIFMEKSNKEITYIYFDCS